jgi:hypothetical protein
MAVKKELLGIMFGGKVRVETINGIEEISLSPESSILDVKEHQQVKGKIVTRRGTKVFVVTDDKITKMLEDLILQESITITQVDIEKLPDMGRGYHVGKMELLNLIIEKFELSIPKVINRKQEPKE